MEQTIFKEGCDRINDNPLWFTDAGHEAPKHVAWFEDQIEQALSATENQALPFDTPAIFWQFASTNYSENNGLRKKAKGQFILHVVQDKQVEGEASSSTIDDHEKLLEYADRVIALLDGYRLECSAKPYLVTVDRDHTNRPVMVDRITFEWTGTRRQPTDVPQ